MNPPRRPPPKPLKLRSRQPPTATAEQVRERSRGALLGLAVGEALGIPYENRSFLAPDFPKLADVELYVRGGGPLSLRPGQTRWATQMAVCIVKGLRQGPYDIEATAKRYSEWAGKTKDVPAPIKQAVALLAARRSPEMTGREVWLANGQRVSDNAALARTAPIGVALSGKRDERLKATFEDTAITHYAFECRLAGAAFNAVLAAAITTASERLTQAEALKVAEADLALGATLLSRSEPDLAQRIKEAADWLRGDLRASQNPDPLLYGPEIHLFHQASHVRVAFRLALWELFHAPSLRVGLEDVVTRGGDADTNAAVAGALFGAVHGEQAIPELWREAVLGSVNMGDDPLAPWHAKELLRLIEPITPDEF